MRGILIDAFLSHAQGHVDKHVANVEVLLQHPVGIGEHQDIMEALETEMEEIAKYHDMIEMLRKYFVDSSN
jgi:ABC-type antimicrobial peptide transport system ATPase subunit